MSALPVLLLLADGRSPDETRVLLSPAEAAFFATLSFPKRQADWLLGRLAAKEAIASAFGVAPALAEVLTERDGRPAIAQPLASGWDLSISHSHGRAAAAIAPAPVGVDLERLRALPEKGLRFFLAPEERDWLASGGLGPHGEIVAWALKEAAYKALHGAISGVRHLQIAGAEADRVRLDSPAGPLVARWRLSGEFCLAIATPGHESPDWLSALGWPMPVHP
jgi:4'-phosphopantetheinyl transferase